MTPTCKTCGSPLEEVHCSGCSGLGTDWDYDPVSGDRIGAGQCRDCSGEGYFWMCPVCPNSQPSWVLGTYTQGEVMA